MSDYYQVDFHITTAALLGSGRAWFSGSAFVDGGSHSAREVELYAIEYRVEGGCIDLGRDRDGLDGGWRSREGCFSSCGGSVPGNV